MLIAQITDLHVRAVDGPGPLGIQINENVMALVAQLNGLQPRPDLVVATGDLTASGESDQYRRLAEILSSLELPLYLIPGNHDEPGPFQELLGRFPGLSGDGDLIFPLKERFLKAGCPEEKIRAESYFNHLKKKST